MTVSVKMLLDVAAHAQTMASEAQAMADSMKQIAEDCAAQLAAKRAEGEAPQAEATTEIPTNPTPTEPPAKRYSIAEVRTFVAERSKPENRAQIKAILKRFGVSKLTELSEEQYVPLMEEVAAL